MNDREWYRVENHGDPRLAAEALLERFPQLSSGSLVISHPEAHLPDQEVDPARLHDGTRLGSDEVRDVLALLLSDAGFRCRLNSSAVSVESTGDAIYVAVPPSENVPGHECNGSLEITQASAPVIAEENDEKRVYPAVSAAFWEDLADRVRHGERLLVLSQWAGGLGGERWYSVFRAEDIPLVRDDLIARSIVAVFPEEFFVKSGVGDPFVTVGADPLYGNLRWLVPLEGNPRWRADLIDDDDDLRRRWSAPETGALLFRWPDDDRSGRVSYAACPDEDGTVRTYARFD